MLHGIMLSRHVRGPWNFHRAICRAILSTIGKEQWRRIAKVSQEKDYDPDNADRRQQPRASLEFASFDWGVVQERYQASADSEKQEECCPDYAPWSPRLDVGDDCEDRHQDEGYSSSYISIRELVIVSQTSL